MAPSKRLNSKKKKEKPAYECLQCGKVLPDNSSYQLHIQIHSDVYPYSCTLCEYKCKIKKYLSRHVKKVHNKASGPECKICGKVFHYDCNLRSHMRVHTGEKPYKCEVCKKAFSSSYCLSMHNLIHRDEKPYKCSFCEYACRDSSTLRKHEQRHMGILKKYPCMMCKRTFTTNILRKLHLDEVHYGLDTRKFPCTKCEKAFRTRAAVKLHIKTVHDKLLRTECEICGRTVNKNNMSTHLQSHVDIKPYKCTYTPCSKRFKDRSSLRKHILIHYPEYQYKCDLCDCKFPRKSRLREHILRHAREHGFTCDYCGISFVRKSFLCTHIKRKHGTESVKFICDDCGLICYTKKCLMLHIKYGHGTERDRKCAVCKKLVNNINTLKEHYFKFHRIQFVVKKTTCDGITVKDEPIEVSAEFDFNYHVDKVEIVEHPPDQDYEEITTTLAYLSKVLEEDISRSAELNAENDFDKFLSQQARKKTNNENKSAYVDIDTTLVYSQSVLEEDLSRNVKETEEIPHNKFEQFFLQQVLKETKKKVLPKVILKKSDRRKVETVKKKVKKMLNETRKKREMENLENTRRIYNERIELAFRNAAGNKETTKITYFKKINNQDNNNLEHNRNYSQHINKSQSDNLDSQINDIPQNYSHKSDNPENESNDSDSNILRNNEINENNTHNNNLLSNNSTSDSIENDITDTSQNDNHDSDTNSIYDTPLSQRRISKRKKKTKVMGYGDRSDKDDSDYVCSDNPDSKKNGKITFDGHECHVCHKLFQTKSDLKSHCSEHFDVCNEKMLKKCPFCGYVTSLNIKRHVQLAHKIHINYAYGHITEKPNKTSNGSKYVLELNNDRELEIIPSIGNLNKIACMKNDERTRQDKNKFIGVTKLVKKGQGWVVEKKPVNLTTEYLLPEFTEEEYMKLNIEGDSYLDRIRMLSHLAKKRGLKMVYPCAGCEKICQTMPALKLHNRKHEKNPKRYKPKVWVNRHIEYKTKNRKNKLSPMKNPVRLLPVKRTVKEPSENRFKSPQPVKNKHKCDKELIEFYKTNIKGGDIEFWQFLKIFNKMSRENVNDFEDLENRNDLHFGVHFKEQNQAITEKEPVITEKEPVLTEKEPELIVKKSVPLKNRNKKFKNFTRAIMISKKDYMRREEIKHQMRKKLKESRV